MKFFQKKVCIHFDPRGKGSKGREVKRFSSLLLSYTQHTHFSLALQLNHPRGYYACISFPGETRILDPARQRTRTGKRDCRPDYFFNIFFFLSFCLSPSPAEAAGLHDSGGGATPRHATPCHATHAHVLYCTGVRHFQPALGLRDIFHLSQFFLSFL